MLLSGRIAPKTDGFRNMTEVNRICKEANFDQYLLEATSRFLVAAEIIRPNEQESSYEPGKSSDAYWNHEFERLREAARHGFFELVQRFAPFRVSRTSFASHSGLDGLVALFAAAFEGRSRKGKPAALSMGSASCPLRTSSILASSSTSRISSSTPEAGTRGSMSRGRRPCFPRFMIPVGPIRRPPKAAVV